MTRILQGAARPRANSYRVRVARHRQHVLLPSDSLLQLLIQPCMLLYYRNLRTVMPCGYRTVLSDPAKMAVETEWTGSMDQMWLNERNPSSLVFGILKCLQACPVDCRRDVVSNLIFCGDGACFMDSERVLKRLRDVINQSADPIVGDGSGDLTVSSLNLTKLSPLAAHCAGRTLQQPDLAAWVGASVWISVWYRTHSQEEDEEEVGTDRPSSSFVQWKYPQEEKDDGDDDDEEEEQPEY